VYSGGERGVEVAAVDVLHAAWQRSHGLGRRAVLGVLCVEDDRGGSAGEALVFLYKLASYVVEKPFCVSHPCVV
jgi:hypothetical protein